MRKFSFKLFSKLPAHEFRMTIPNILTSGRIILVPAVVGAMYWGFWGTAFLLFFVACLTDLFDGLLARVLSQKTFLGACLDPLADKLLLVSCFAMLTWTGILPFGVPHWFLTLVLLRELLLISGFVYLYYSGRSVQVQPTLLGKITTAFQMFFIMWLFGCYFYGWLPTKTYYVSLLVITGCVIASFFQYARIAWKRYQ